MACWRARENHLNSFSEKLFGPKLKLRDGSEVYVYHQELDGSSAIAPRPLDDDDVMASLPRPTCLEDLGFPFDDDDDGGNKMIPACPPARFFPLEQSPYALKGSISRFYYKGAVDTMEAELQSKLDVLPMTSHLHDAENDDEQFALDITVEHPPASAADDGDGQDGEGGKNGNGAGDGGDGGGGDGDGDGDSEPPWDYSVSIFHPRVKESDSRSMFDTAACHKRAFKSDWAKCLEKGDRFLNIIKKGCTDPKEKAVVKTAEIMERYYPRVLFMFVIYCCMADATNCSWMTFGSFAAFVEDAEIADDESTTCRTSDIDTIFKATDFDSTRGKSGNPGKSLTRSEFAEALIRISHAKFGGKGVDAHMVIERLLKHVFARVGDAACRDFRPEWRQRVLYTAPVDKVLKKYEDVLERIFYENDESYWTGRIRIRWRSRTSTRTPSRGTRAT